MPIEPSPRKSAFVQVMLVAYLAALAYGSLYPMQGWRPIGGSPFDFLIQPWPRYWTRLDLLANVAVYAPLGAIGVALLRRAELGALRTVLIVSLTGSAMSILLESLQNYLPGRVPSRLDWIANSAGALLGALSAAAWARQERRHPAWQRASLEPFDASLGLALLTAWVVVQCHPQRVLFGHGALIDPPVLLPRLGPAYGVLAEALASGGALVAIGMMVRELFPPAAPRRVLTTSVVAAGLMAKSVGAAWLRGPDLAFAWLSAGAQGGLVIGAIALALLASAQRRARLWIAFALLVSTAVLTNVFPVDAYHDTMSSPSSAGAWRNFDGLLRGAALFWPVVALAWCIRRLSALRAEAGSIMVRKP